ncbi:MAG TPA: NUDIX hydrolase [Candidatus Saccharimonadales bacterium]|jgi:8-oxo-dGTP diphosphatase
MTDEESTRKQALADNVTHFATGIAVFRDSTLLVVRRAVEDDFLGGEWELPGGGVDAGETIEQGAIRELLEETSLAVDKIIETFESFDYATPKKPKVRQINYKVTVKSGDIKLEPTEHDAYRWVVAADIPGLKTNAVMQECLYNAFK